MWIVARSDGKPLIFRGITDPSVLVKIAIQKRISQFGKSTLFRRNRFYFINFLEKIMFL